MAAPLVWRHQNAGSCSGQGSGLLTHLCCGSRTRCASPGTQAAQCQRDPLSRDVARRSQPEQGVPVTAAAARPLSAKPSASPAPHGPLVGQKRDPQRFPPGFTG